MEKALTPTETIKKQSDNTKTPTKTTITQRLLADLERSVGVTTATQLVWLNRFMGSQPFLLRKTFIIRRTYISKFVNYPSYRDRE